ncbi:M64 family metallopeptidase [Mangrovimonas sp. TPBH4]|uniref:T9SS type A sorting domain-containing protein n=1 Tax=Mangrovimonas sp. TPBH4 TaxID=1645914 RepID=UPI0006B4BF47|nr:M64 family metallopeptidase [Mangrovimonas sp. TPBH4]
MKQPLALIVLFFISNIVHSQVFEVDTIKYSGTNTSRINFVVMGDGYTGEEQDQFITDVTNFSNFLFSQSPFLEYEDYFNLYAIKVISNESGASHPGNAPDEPSTAVPITIIDNYFGSSFDNYNIHRLLYTPNSALIATVLATNVPEYDEGIVLVNTPYYGGSGGDFAICSTGIAATEIAIHELGHTFADLKDEYYAGDVYFGEAYNMTQENNPELIKWKNWFNTNNIGAYSYGTSGLSATWYKPHQSCKMQYLGEDFCSVCTEAIIEKIHSLISPIASFTPENNAVGNPEFPLQFQLYTINPEPNSLQISWNFNGSDMETEGNSISLYQENLASGSNTLTAIVTDGSSLVNVDNHETLHVYSVTWTIDYTLSNGSISSKQNALNISLFPNPSSNIVNITFKSELNQNLSVEISDLNGKQILSTQLNNGTSTTIDIGQFESGLYLANFYANNVLMATKKVIKN